MSVSLKRRIISLYALIILGYCIVLSRCFFVQVVHHAWFVKRAMSQVQSVATIPVKRGIIYDRVGIPLVATHQATSAYLSPRRMSDDRYVHYTQEIQKSFPDRIPSFMRARTLSFWYLIRHCNDTQKVYLDLCYAPDIAYVQEPCRVGAPESLRDIVGLCDIDTRGISGLELMYDTILRGSPATWLLSKDGRQHEIPSAAVCIQEGTPSHDVHTTLDLDITSYAHDELVSTMHSLGSTAGAVLIMDPYTGDVVCATQHQHEPDGACSKGPSHHHMAVTQSFELGSVMKTFLALAAYQTEQVTSDELIDCMGTQQAIVYGFPVSTWKAHGTISFFDIIRFSNNIGTAQVARRVGTELFNVYRQCGFGCKTGIDWPGEVSGFINPPERWSAQSLNSLSFGYEIQATLLQLACAYGLIYTGWSVTPRLNRHQPVKMISSRIKPMARQETLAILQAMIEPHKQRWQRPDILLYGKTGTARMLDATGHYSPYKHIYTFAGIIARPDYARVIVTCVKEASRHDLYASNVTLPLFMRIAWYLAVHDRL
jgi:cell division protein FtsI/penicillin-binding protein 2